MEVDLASKDGTIFANKNGFTVTVSKGWDGRWEAGILVTCYRDKELLYKRDFILDTETPNKTDKIYSEEEVENELRKDLNELFLAY